MSVAVFFVLALACAGVIVLPLLPGRGPADRREVVSDEEIDSAVREVVRVRAAGALACPACGRGHNPGDRFCVGCGRALSRAAQGEGACASCGTAYREADRFCARCGEPRPGQEVQ